MKSPVKWTVAALVLLGVALIGLQQRWWGLEPATGGRTVTEWLDRMALFDGERQRDQTGQSSSRSTTNPVVVTNDAALKALVRLGPRAVTVLKERLAEPPRLAFQERFTNWLRTWWWQWRTMNQPFSPPPFPHRLTFTPSSRDEARKYAASLALMAIGRDAGGGAVTMLETLAEAGANWPPNGSSGRLYHPSYVLPTAVLGLPHRRAEMAQDIFASLSHTNPLVRCLAADSARHFEAEIRTWKPGLLHLAAEDPDSGVRASALWSLATRLRNDGEVTELCVATLSETNNPFFLRSSAASGLFFCDGRLAAKYLPQLEAIADEAKRAADESSSGIKDLHLHLWHSLRDTIRNINKNLAQ
jgi:hypothetical protein